MELKEIEKKFEQYINSFNKDIPKEHIDLISPKGIVLDFIQSFGKEQYNQALLDASEKCNYPYKDEYGCGCNVPSIILSLKKITIHHLLKAIQ